MQEGSRIIRIPTKELCLDNLNPRLSEFGISEKTKEEVILKTLWDEMGVDEVMYSIVSNGFWEYEPLVALKPGANGVHVVIEGNRRLSAVKLLLGHVPKEIQIPQHIIDKVKADPHLVARLVELPVILVNSREEAWEFIGFKHVNGPAKWGSFAKAQYISEIHNEFGIPLADIAYRLGDTHNTVEKLYQGLMVLEQARKAGVYDYKEDVVANRIYFSHLYTGLQRSGIREFLNLKDSQSHDANPVPEERLKNLGELLTWLFGKKGDGVKSIIQNQNPDLKNLDEILSNAEALSAIRSGVELQYAHELSRPSVALFEENLLAVKRHLLKCRAYLTGGYDGEITLLKSAGTIAEMAEDIYNEMFRKYQELGPKKGKDRITE